MEPLLDPEFYSNITKEVDEAWKEKHGKNVSETIKDYLLTYLGEPLHQLIRYILSVYLRHYRWWGTNCVGRQCGHVGFHVSNPNPLIT